MLTCFETEYQYFYGESHYKLVTFDGIPYDYRNGFQKIGSFVDFGKGNGAESRDECPHPRIVDFHLTIARILEATGLKQRLDAMQEELTEMSVCASDGSTDLGTLVQWGLEHKGIRASKVGDAANSGTVAESE